jgi:hypothetical protein
MSSPRPAYNLLRYYEAEFDGQAERVSMAQGRAEFFMVVEVGKGGKELVARRERAVEILLAAMKDGLAPGRRGVIVTPATLAAARLAHPEKYGEPLDRAA